MGTPFACPDSASSNVCILPSSVILSTVELTENENAFFASGRGVGGTKSGNGYKVREESAHV